MAQVELIMPKMGESIIEATILKWVKNVGDKVEIDETVLEIATDKVDSEVPSPVEGTIVEILYDEEDVVEIGEAVAIIETEGEEGAEDTTEADDSSSATDIEESSEDIKSDSSDSEPQQDSFEPSESAEKYVSEDVSSDVGIPSKSNRFYSPLVRNIAQTEGISQEELESIPGTGMNNRVTKKDILAYIEKRKTQKVEKEQPKETSKTARRASSPSSVETTGVKAGEGEEIVEMGRMRQLIADHMVNSKRTSPHVTSFVEVDVTKIVQWRNRIKQDFKEKYGQKITYTPIFMEAIIKGIHDFPGVNVSVDGNKIIKKNYINLGMAAARPDGNLIVPVIHNADELSLLGLTKKVNDLAHRARSNDLTADEIQGGTFTLTNVGTFGNVMGTPIINQPQVAILAAGAIKKKPAVIETDEGDVIAVRHKMFLSLSYDHRVVDGILGGSFLSRVGQYLEEFDDSRKI